MRRRVALRGLGAAGTGVLAVVALLFASPAAGSSGSAAQSVATYGPTRDWGGTQIRSVNPLPPLPVGSGTSSASDSSPATRSSSGSRTASASSVPADAILSNEFSSTQWAYVARGANVYASPSGKSRVITRLQWYTESGFPEIYLALRAHWNRDRHEWIEVRIPGRPNGRVGWVLRSKLGRFHMTHELLVVNRETLHMYFYKNGHRIWSAPVGVGAPSTPTPPGHFWITEEFVITDPSSGYYPFAFGTSDYSTLTDWPEGGVVGIHGPYFAPWSAIPGRISHGCIRLHVPDDFWLGHHLNLGAPVLVK